MVGKKYPLCYKVLPVDADIKNIKFEVIESKDVLSIDSKGIITVLKPDNSARVKITITNMDGTTISNSGRIATNTSEANYRPCDDSGQVYTK